MSSTSWIGYRLGSTIMCAICSITMLRRISLKFNTNHCIKGAHYLKVATLGSKIFNEAIKYIYKHLKILENNSTGIVPDTLQ